MDSSHPERKAFSARLLKACERAGIPDIGPTRLQREFNLRSEASVTVHAARKWICEESIPGQQKLRTLAQWLQVSPEWLRFGDARSVQQPFSATDGLLPNEARMLTDVRCLSGPNKQIVDEMIAILLKSQK